MSVSEPVASGAIVSVSVAGPVIRPDDVSSEWERPHMGLTWMTCASDRLEHAVTDEECAAAFQQNSGIYRAVCGHLVAAQAMASPPGKRCRICMALLYELVMQPRRDGWLKRLVLRGGR